MWRFIGGSTTHKRGDKSCLAEYRVLLVLWLSGDFRWIQGDVGRPQLPPLVIAGRPNLLKHSILLELRPSNPRTHREGD